MSQLTNIIMECWELCVSRRKDIGKPNVDKPRFTRLHTRERLIALQSRDKQCQSDSMKFDLTAMRRSKKRLINCKTWNLELLMSCCASSMSPMHSVFSWTVHWTRLCGNNDRNIESTRHDNSIPSPKSCRLEKLEYAKDGNSRIILSLRRGEFHVSLVKKCMTASVSSTNRHVLKEKLYISL